jgi:hypothetical protein
MRSSCGPILALPSVPQAQCLKPSASSPVRSGQTQPGTLSAVTLTSPRSAFFKCDGAMILPPFSSNSRGAAVSLRRIFWLSRKTIPSEVRHRWPNTYSGCAHQGDQTTAVSCEGTGHSSPAEPSALPLPGHREKQTRQPPGHSAVGLRNEEPDRSKRCTGRWKIRGQQHFIMYLYPGEIAAR